MHLPFSLFLWIRSLSSVQLVLCSGFHQPTISILFWNSKSSSKLTWLLEEFNSLWLEDWGSCFPVNCQPGASLSFQRSPGFFAIWPTHRPSLTTAAYFLKSEVKLLSRVRFFVTPWTAAYQASLSRGFSRQEYWSRLPFPSPGDRPNPRVKPRSPALSALPSEPPGKLKARRQISLTSSLL